MNTATKNPAISAKCFTVKHLEAAKCPTVNDLKSERAAFVQAVRREAQEEKKKERARQAWQKNGSYSWIRHVNASKDVRLVLSHPSADYDYASDEISLTICQGKAAYNLTLPRVAMHQISVLLRNACAHSKQQKLKVLEKRYL